MLHTRTANQCYVGKKRLERAIDVYNQAVHGERDVFTITWHPFYLDPSLPKESVDRAVYLGNKYGSGQVETMHARLRSLGEANGIRFSLKGKIGNTRDAHRLVQLAKTKSNKLENDVVAALFKSHFEEDGDLTSTEVLVAAAERAGLDKDEAKEWLQQGKGGDEVDKEVQVAYGAGVFGVPNFTINGQYEISGAQDVETFIKVFDQVKEAAPAVGAGSPQGVSC